jgi:regulator of replication initiation timing
MKLKKKVFDIFNLSFLDIISCGFGAVVLLVLISKSADDSSQSKVSEVENLLGRLHHLESSIKTLAKDIEQLSQEARTFQAENGELEEATKKLTQSLAVKKRQEESLEDDLAGLSLIQTSLQKVTITPATSKTIRDEEVGGIPVDSDYVIFVVDTSGSMQTIWDRVSREILNVLSIHPNVKGFQILNDQGKPLISGYKGRWIPDTPKRRKSVMQVFHSWQDASNSSPVEGIETALRLYAKEGQSTAIYVFGDDYTGSSYDQAVNSITKMNRRQKNGRQLAKIHGVGFLSGLTTGRFGILMRELTKRNGGTFLALPI